MVIKTTTEIDKSILKSIRCSKETFIKDLKRKMFEDMSLKLFEHFEHTIEKIDYSDKEIELYEYQLAIFTKGQIKDIIELTKSFANLEISKDYFLSEFEKILNETKI